MITITIRLSVSSLLRTERFYRDGLGLLCTRVGSIEDGYLLLQPEDATWQMIAEPWMVNHLSLPGRFPPDSPTDGAGTGIQLQFYCAEVRAKFQLLCNAGGTPVRPPAAMGDGELVAIVGDPDGYLVTLTGPAETVQSP